MIKLRKKTVNKAHHKNPKIIAATACIIPAKCTLAPSFPLSNVQPFISLETSYIYMKKYFPLLGVKSIIIGTIYMNVSNHTKT